MAKIRVGVAGYGTIGQRLADGVALQEDMELVGIADLAPTLSLQALRERDMIGANGVKYNLYLVDGADKAAFDAKKIPVAGTFEDLCKNVDVMLDSSPGGVGAANKEKYYVPLGVKAIFQGGEKNSAKRIPKGCAIATLKGLYNVLAVGFVIGIFDTLDARLFYFYHNFYTLLKVDVLCASGFFSLPIFPEGQSIT